VVRRASRKRVQLDPHDEREDLAAEAAQQTDGPFEDEDTGHEQHANDMRDVHHVVEEDHDGGQQERGT
jgi:hypothetical protein